MLPGPLVALSPWPPSAPGRGHRPHSLDASRPPLPLPGCRPHTAVAGERGFGWPPPFNLWCQVRAPGARGLQPCQPPGFLGAASWFHGSQVAPPRAGLASAMFSSASSVPDAPFFPWLQSRQDGLESRVGSTGPAPSPGAAGLTQTAPQPRGSIAWVPPSPPPGCAQLWLLPAAQHLVLSPCASAPPWSLRPTPRRGLAAEPQGRGRRGPCPPRGWLRCTRTPGAFHVLCPPGSPLPTEPEPISEARNQSQALPMTSLPHNWGSCPSPTPWIGWWSLSLQTQAGEGLG